MGKAPKLEPGTPLHSINEWNIARQNLVYLSVLLGASGNSFTLKSIPRTKGKKLHIYIGLNDGKLELYSITNDNDKGVITNADLTPIQVLSSKKSINITHEHSINSDELITAIDHWVNPVNIAAWVSQNFSAEPTKNNILQAFIIDTTDFMDAYSYEGYVALKMNDSMVSGAGYTLDLVIVNTETGEILNLEKTGNVTHYRDLARLVPPFGQEIYPSTDKSNFAVLSTLGIQ